MLSSLSPLCFKTAFSLRFPPRLSLSQENLDELLRLILFFSSMNSKNELKKYILFDLQIWLQLFKISFLFITHINKSSFNMHFSVALSLGNIHETIVEKLIKSFGSKVNYNKSNRVKHNRNTDSC